MASKNQVCVRVLRKQLQLFRFSSQQPSRSSIHSSAGHALPRPRSTLLQKALSRRPITTYSTPTDRLKANIKRARDQNPILLPVLFLLTLTSITLLGVLAYKQHKYLDPQLAGWPKPVAYWLRVALTHTHVRPDPDLAAKYFVRSIEAAKECGMDPLAKEVMGIRIRLAEMLETFGRARQSIDVLEGIVEDCEEMLSQLSRNAIQKQLAGKASSEAENQKLHTSMLRNIIQAKVKIAGLYASDYIKDSQQAKKVLSDAVGLLVKNTQDPQTDGFTEDNAAGLNLEEIASILSQMGDMYATSGEESNAIQVYMLTLDPLRKACNGTRSCKEVQVLSNIAASMGLALKKPSPIINGKPATNESLAMARKAAMKWADLAIATVDKVDSAERDDICVLGVFSAQMTKADLLLDAGEKAQSRDVFRSMLPTLREKGLTSLIQTVEGGMKRAED